MPSIMNFGTLHINDDVLIVKTGIYSLKKSLLLAALIVSIAVPSIRHLLKTQAYVDALQTGVILEATVRNYGRLFKNSKVLLTAYSKQDVSGVVLNESIEQGLGRYSDTPDITYDKENSRILFWGGPVKLEQAFVIDYAPETSSFRRIPVDGEGFAEQYDQVFRGYAGWRPGQLEWEIKRGDWRVTKAKVSELEQLFKQ